MDARICFEAGAARGVTENEGAREVTCPLEHHERVLTRFALLYGAFGNLDRVFASAEFENRSIWTVPSNVIRNMGYCLQGALRAAPSARPPRTPSAWWTTSMSSRTTRASWPSSCLPLCSNSSSASSRRSTPTRLPEVDMNARLTPPDPATVRVGSGPGRGRSALEQELVQGARGAVGDRPERMADRH